MHGPNSDDTSTRRALRSLVARSTEGSLRPMMQSVVDSKAITSRRGSIESSESAVSGRQLDKSG